MREVFTEVIIPRKRSSTIYPSSPMPSPSEAALTETPQDNQVTPIRQAIAKRKLGIGYAVRGVVVLVGIILLIGIVLAVRHFVLDPNTGATKAAPQPVPTTVAHPALTTLQQVRAAFRPWQLVPGTDASSQAPNLVLLHENGSVEASVTTVDFHPQDWTTTQPFELRSLAGHDGVFDISTAEGKLFTVGAEQPFIFDQDPQHVYLITSDQRVWQSTSQAVKAKA